MDGSPQRRRRTAQRRRTVDEENSEKEEDGREGRSRWETRREWRGRESGAEGRKQELCLGLQVTPAHTLGLSFSSPAANFSVQLWLTCLLHLPQGDLREHGYSTVHGGLEGGSDRAQPTLRTMMSGWITFVVLRQVRVQVYYEAWNDYTNNSETVLLCNRCVCNRKTNSQTINV